MHERNNLKSETNVARLAPADLSKRPAAVERLPAPSGDQAAFLRGFLRHPGQVGSVIPSSSRLEQRLVRCAHPADAAVVLELGPGTGGTTRALLAAMRADARLLAIELDPAFNAHLSRNIRDPRFSAHLGSAEEIEQTLAAYRLPPAGAGGDRLRHPVLNHARRGGGSHCGGDRPRARPGGPLRGLPGACPRDGLCEPLPRHPAAAVGVDQHSTGVRLHLDQEPGPGDSLGTVAAYLLARRLRAPKDSSGGRAFP